MKHMSKRLKSVLPMWCVSRREEASWQCHLLRGLLDAAEDIEVYPQLHTQGYPDVQNISGADLLEELNYCYDHFGLEETLVVCRSNKRANLFNQGIRNSVLYREDELTSGDYLLVMKNN